MEQFTFVNYTFELIDGATENTLLPKQSSKICLP